MATTPNVPAGQLAEIEITNRQEFFRFLQNAGKSAEDLRIPFGLIGRSQFKFQRAIFELVGPGRYQPLSRGYQKFKKQKFGRIFPILFATGRLAKSLLNPGSENVLKIGKREMFYGTRVPYGIKHQEGIGVPRRPFLFIDDQRKRAWAEIVLAHIKKSLVRPTGAPLSSGKLLNSDLAKFGPFRGGLPK